MAESRFQYEGAHHYLFIMQSHNNPVIRNYHAHSPREPAQTEKRAKKCSCTLKEND